MKKNMGWFTLGFFHLFSCFLMLSIGWSSTPLLSVWRFSFLVFVMFNRNQKAMFSGKKKWRDCSNGKIAVRNILSSASLSKDMNFWHSNCLKFEVWKMTTLTFNSLIVEHSYQSIMWNIQFEFPVVRFMHHHINRKWLHGVDAEQTDVFFRWNL